MEKKGLADMIATKYAPLEVREGKAMEYAAVYLEEEGYIRLLSGSSLKVERLVIHSGNPDYTVLATGRDGEDGEPGQDGENAPDGKEIRLEIGVLTDPIKIVIRGGRGGDGGYGGHGGNGSNGSFNGKGAPGGDGGNGGNGGDGGNGPHLIVDYYTPNESGVEIQCLASQGGNGGAAGMGGKGGKNGDSDTYAADGKPGESGRNGLSGKKGSVCIQKHPGRMTGGKRREQSEQE